MASKKKGHGVVVSRSPEALAVMLRGGSGKHGDRRTKRNRTRSAQKRTAIAAW